MKLNDFVNKKSIRRSTSPPRFVLDNEALDSKYKDQIAELNAELGRYRTMEADRDGARRKLIVAQESFESLKSDSDNLEDEIKTLKVTISDQEGFLQNIPKLQKEIDQLNFIKGYSKEIETKNSLLLKEITTLKKNIEDKKEELLIIANSEVKKRSDEEVSILNQQVLEKNKKLETFADETSRINIEVKKQNRQLRDKINFWEKESKAMAAQLEESIQLESKLMGLITNLENEETKNTSIKGGLNKRLESSKASISEMETAIEDLRTDNNYLSRINSNFRKELSKPKYLSMGSIAKREGFKMPQGMENIRTRNLGNAAPTLLKFNPKKENSYGN
jgi:chromosome segregation ATPase